MEIGFHHGALCDTYEEQARAQGFTFGEYASFIEEVGHGIVTLYIHGCLTDGEYDKVLRKFQKNFLVNKKYLRRLNRSEPEKILELEEYPVIEVDGKKYHAEHPVIKTIDKNGICSIGGFKEVEDA